MRNFLSSINSEPTIFLYSIALGLYITVYQAFIKFKLCMEELGTSRELCRNLKNETRLAEKVSGEAAHYMLYLQLCGALPAFIMCFFIGAWSDKNGRKTPLLFALLGITLMSFLLLLMSAVPTIPLWVMLIASVVTGLTGQMIIVFSSCFSMISDRFLKDPPMLTVRLGIGSGLVYFGIVCGSLISGWISAKIEHTYVYIFLISTVFMSVGFIYTTVFVRETIQFIKIDGMTINTALEEDFIDLETTTCCQSFCQFFHFDRIKEAFEILRKHRPGRIRCHLLLGVVVFLVLFSCDIGMPGLQYLFLTVHPLDFTDSQYSVLVAVQTGFSALGMCILPFLLIKVFRLNDTWLIIIAFLFSIGKSLIFAFSKTLWMVFLSATLNIGATVYFPGFRAYLTKLVERTEIARLFALLSAIDQVGPIFSGLLFNNLYAVTMEFFPGFIWVLGSCIMGAMLVIACWLHYDSRNIDSFRVEETDRIPIVVDAEQVEA